MPDYALYSVKVSLLTPMHIGSGRDLWHEYDYAVLNGQTWRINEAAVLDTQNVTDPAIADRLARTPPAQLLKKPGDFRPESGFFRYVIKGTPRSEAAGAQLREQIKDIFDRPYLPGSSLKGALRTALGWYAWGQMKLSLEVGRLGRRREWAAQDYEHTIFGPNPNQDVLRALQVSDSGTVGADRLMVLNARVVGRGGHLASPIELEAIRSDTIFGLTLKLDRALFSDWARRHGLELPGGGALEQLPQIVQAHAMQRIEKEKAWFAAIKGAERLTGFYQQMAQARLGQNMFLTQIGWGGGWDGKTFGSRLQADNAFMERAITDYRLARGSRRQGDPFPKSRRVAVAFNRDANGRTDEAPAAPLGWALVEMIPVKREA